MTQPATHTFASPDLVQSVMAYASHAFDLTNSDLQNVRFSKHQVMRWLEERSFQPRLVHGKGSKRQ